MGKWKVVVSDWEYEDLNIEQKVLDDEEIELIPAQCRTEDDVIAHCRHADAIINQYAPIGRRAIEALKNCKVIARYGVGVNTIDLEAGTDKDICVANVPDYCIDEVSDHALALLLDCARKVTFANRITKEEKWDFKRTRPIYRLRERTLGLVGFGKIPQRLAEKAQAIGLTVIAYDPYFPKEAAAEKGVNLVSLEDLCTASDFISVHAPLTKETQGLMGKEQFEKMKAHAFVINTSRGPVIDEEALVNALESGRIAGAALDVVEEEPIRRDHPLLSMNNVILTPHIAWYSEQAEQEMRTKVAEGVRDVLLLGKYPKYLVNRKVIESLALRS